MSIAQFFRIRLIRLHPMVMLGVFIGAIGFWFDPFTSMRPAYGLFDVIIALLLGWLLMPSPDIRGWGETHQLNGPSWSLLQEYIANIMYALFVRKFNKGALTVLVVVSAVVLTGVAHWRGDIGTGWSYDTFWIAVVRMMYPFFAGLLLFRTGKLIRIPFAFTLCSIALGILFFLPHFGNLNGFYEAGVIILVFPLIVAVGAGGEVSGFMKKLCRFSGDISYPIYITHYPFIYIYTMWIHESKATPEQIIPVAIGLFFLFILLAYASLKWYDEPVRSWLKRKCLRA
jgi:peptidoglycan/LPS O-acetylase OafA/YrhL